MERQWERAFHILVLVALWRFGKPVLLKGIQAGMWKLWSHVLSVLLGW